MIAKPERIIKRITKAVGERQAVLIIGDWQEELIKGIREKQNSITIKSSTENLEDNRFTRIVIDYSSSSKSFFSEARRLLLPTGKLIISADSEDGIFDKIINLFRKKGVIKENIKKIKPKVLQDQIHDNDFLIDGYYGYPGGDLLMIAQIQNKEVTTLFRSERQETITI